MVAVVCASAVPPVDDPETAFNEADATIILATPASVGLNLLPAASDLAIVPNLSLDQLGWVVNNFVHGRSQLARQHPPSSLQKLLCTFLI